MRRGWGVTLFNTTQNKGTTPVKNTLFNFHDQNSKNAITYHIHLTKTASVLIFKRRKEKLSKSLVNNCQELISGDKV